MAGDGRIFIHLLVTHQAAIPRFAILTPVYIFPEYAAGAIATFGLPQQ
jgi:hypothetical protein